MWSVCTLNETVEKELWALPAKIQARFFRIAELIENHGLPNVGLPYIKHVQDEI